MSLIAKDFVREAQRMSAHDVLHREAVLARILRVCDRPVRNNILILGEPGVGKTALMEGLAFRLAHHAHGIRQIKKVMLINTARLAMLLAERDLDELERERQALSGLRSCLIVVDDARLLLAQSDLTALQYFLQPLLELRDLSVAMLCTMGDFRKHFERDPIFFREMEPIQVEELDLGQAQDVIVSLVAVRMQETKCRISAVTATQAVTLAKRYLADRALPDKALSLLNEAMAKAIAEDRAIVEISDCKQVIADRTGIPVDTLSASDQEKLLNLEKGLDAQIIGQAHVTQAVAKVIRRSRAGLKDAGRPIASFLFLGSSGVGKTELAKVLTRTVYHNERAMLRFDMSEFGEPHNVQRLVGAPPGYVGFEEGGQLTNAVLGQPYSLILLDEIEKAHPKVFDIFLQVMDDGRLTDGKGRTVDFSNCIIIATSNIALEEILAGFQQGEAVTEKGWYEERILPLLSSYFRPEFVNRFDDVLVFSPFTVEALIKIAELETAKLRRRLEEQGIELDLDPVELRGAVERLYSPIFGARPIRRYLQDTIENDVANTILGHR